jgi:hypothetical protein
MIERKKERKKGRKKGRKKKNAGGLPSNAINH